MLNNLLNKYLRLSNISKIQKLFMDLICWWCLDSLVYHRRGAIEVPNNFSNYHKWLDISKEYVGNLIKFKLGAFVKYFQNDFFHNVIVIKKYSCIKRL